MSSLPHGSVNSATSRGSVRQEGLFDLDCHSEAPDEALRPLTTSGVLEPKVAVVAASQSDAG